MREYSKGARRLHYQLFERLVVGAKTILVEQFAEGFEEAGLDNLDFLGPERLLKAAEVPGLGIQNVMAAQIDGSHSMTVGQYSMLDLRKSSGWVDKALLPGNHTKNFDNFDLGQLGYRIESSLRYKEVPGPGIAGGPLLNAVRSDPVWEFEETS
jgi:hypothetical protein